MLMEEVPVYSTRTNTNTLVVVAKDSLLERTHHWSKWNGCCSQSSQKSPNRPTALAAPQPVQAAYG